MADELMRRPTGPLDHRRRSKDERQTLRTDQFEVERTRLRQYADAQLADDQAELVTLLAERNKDRAVAATDSTNLHVRLRPDDPALELDLREFDQIARGLMIRSMINFGRATG